MNAHWTEGLGALGAQLSGKDVLAFNSPAAELCAGQDGTVIVPLTHLGLLECSGDEAKTFLHNPTPFDPDIQVEYRISDFK